MWLGKISWTEEPGGPWGRKESGTSEQLTLNTSYEVGEVWHAAVYGVAKSWTRLSN